jgi:uncharacterized protein (DUF1800 family)
VSDPNWTEAHVRRLFWRAGFGATPAEAARWAGAGKAATLRWIMSGDGAAKLEGPAPGVDGHGLDPRNEWGHDTLWWLDRMVRTSRPLEEKMTLFWADHFACRDQDTPALLELNATLRRHALGDFGKLLQGVTVSRAMLLFLSLAGSDPAQPNENYPRELLELFTLGKGYTERDVREAARAMTGWKVRWTASGGPRTYYRARERDLGTKRIFGHRGRFDYRDVLKLAVAHPGHAPFLVGKLWAFFVATPLDGATRKVLVRRYRGSGHRIAPVVSAILAHPALYANLDAPDMVKSPLVLVAGGLRATRRGVDVDSWTWLLGAMGQTPFSPPSVAGWDWGPAWMSTTTMRGRFETANYLTQKGALEVEDDSIDPGWDAERQLEAALDATGRPWISGATRATLLGTARSLNSNLKSWEVQNAATQTQRALRHLLLSGPDAQLH